MIEMMGLAAWGAAAGLLNGWIGLGGMSILVPAILLAGHAPEGAVVPYAFANAFAVTAISSAFAWGRGHAKGTVNYDVARRTALPSVLGATLAFSGILLTNLSGHGRLMLGVFLLVMAALMWRTRRAPAQIVSPTGSLLGWSAAGGVASGIFCFNGNAYFIPLLRKLGMSPHASIATTQVTGTLIAAVAAVAYALWGRMSGLMLIDLPVVAALSITGAAFNLLGCSLKNRSKERSLAFMLCSAYLIAGGWLVSGHFTNPAAQTRLHDMHADSACSVSPPTTKGRQA